MFFYNNFLMLVPSVHLKVISLKIFRFWLGFLPEDVKYSFRNSGFFLQRLNAVTMCLFTLVALDERIAKTLTLANFAGESVKPEWSKSIFHFLITFWFNLCKRYWFVVGYFLGSFLTNQQTLILKQCSVTLDTVEK